MGAAPITAGAVLMAGVAVTLELLPERIDLFGFVLQFAGLGSLVALLLAVSLGEDDAVYAKYGTLAGAYAGLLLFAALAAAKGLN